MFCVLFDDVFGFLVFVWFSVECLVVVSRLERYSVVVLFGGEFVDGVSGFRWVIGKMCGIIFDCRVLADCNY